jgi:xanthine dehydrogenase small subunit
MNQHDPAPIRAPSIAPIRFWRAGRIHNIDSPSPNQTLLEYLRSAEGLNACGTKEGCAEGDCGACTVVIAELVNTELMDAELVDEAKLLKYRAINSCIRFAYQLDGCALWTVEDLSAPDAPLHPVQKAMLEAHGTQCGFCTPGFVMSLFGLYQSSLAQEVDRPQAIAALSGNLCRCTGYRPILDAAQAMMRLPKVEQPEQAIKAVLLRLAQEKSLPRESTTRESTQRVFRPRDLQTLLQLRGAHPTAQLIAGATDVGLWVTKLGVQFESVIDLSGTPELQSIEVGKSDMVIGAAVRLEDAYRAIVSRRPQLATFAQRFAGLPVRQSGTLGGNLANGSPIGDSMPLLISLGAKIRLASQARGSRQIALEDFYLAYRQTQLAADEVLTHILIPLPHAEELSRIYKVSKRFEDDISAVCIGINISLDQQRTSIRSARVGVGGMAATPRRAYKTELALAGQDFSLASFHLAKEVIGHEFSPLDDMRASATYRRQVAGNLLLRFWEEIQHPQQVTHLESFDAAPIVWQVQIPRGASLGQTEVNDKSLGGVP